MVRADRGKISRTSTTKSFLKWLELDLNSEEETVHVLQESQKALLNGLRQAIGEAQSLTYEIERGAFVRLYPEGEESFTLEFTTENPAQHDVTRLYDVYFPFPVSDESPVSYHGRLLEGLDAFVDDLALSPLVAVDR